MRIYFHTNKLNKKNLNLSKAQVGYEKTTTTNIDSFMTAEKSPDKT